MLALVYDGSLRLAHLAQPQPADGEALVRVEACAIARADLDRVRGIRSVEVRPAVLGSEFVGEVVEARGAAATSWVGRRVVAQPPRGCGRCLRCRDHRPWLCDDDRDGGLGEGVRDGAFAQWIRVPVHSLVEVPEAVDDEEAVFAHPLAAALSAAHWVQGPAPQRVLVVGDGNIGLLVTLVLHAGGHTVTVLGRHPSRRDLLWRSGISFVGVQDTGAAGGILTEIPFTPESFGTVYECSGRPSGYDLSLAAVRPQGRLVLLSHHPQAVGFDLRPVVEKEIELLGVRGGHLEDALDLLSRKRIDTLPLVSGRYPLREGLAAFDQAARRGSLKVILQPSRDTGVVRSRP